MTGNNKTRAFLPLQKLGLTQHDWPDTHAAPVIVSYIALRHLPDGLDSLVPEPLRFDDLEISSPAQGPPKHLFRFRHIDLEEEAPVTVFSELLRRVAGLFADERRDFRCEPDFDVLGFQVRGVDPEDVGPAAGEVGAALFGECQGEFSYDAYPARLEASYLFASTQ